MEGNVVEKEKGRKGVSLIFGGQPGSEEEKRNQENIYWLLHNNDRSKIERLATRDKWPRGGMTARARGCCNTGNTKLVQTTFIYLGMAVALVAANSLDATSCGGREASNNSNSGRHEYTVVVLSPPP